MISCVSFDADGTLFDFERAMRDALAGSLTEIREAVPGPATEALTVERLIATRDEVAREAGGVRSMESLRLLAFGRTLAEAGRPDPDLAVLLTERYLQRRFRYARPYPDVAPALDTLGGRYRLGLATNGNSYPERSGLAGRFDFVVLAQDVGYAKPDPRFYEAVLAAATVPARRVVHVGDSPANDVAGAHEAGMRAVWLNRGDTGRVAAPEAVGEIRTLEDLPTLLERME